jgi:DNA (cytosine-5)-methyltransferase 1
VCRRRAPAGRGLALPAPPDRPGQGPPGPGMHRLRRQPGHLNMAAYYNENNPLAAECLRELVRAGQIAHGHVDQRSIADVRTADLSGFTQCHFFAGVGGWSLALRLAGWADDRPVWTGSCPCQPFSVAGKKKGVNDERHLWPEFRRLILSARPDVLFGEQVAGPNGIAWASGVSDDLVAGGYEAGFFVLPAYAFGSPQKRDRTYFVAHPAVSDARGRAADVWRDGRVQPVAAHPWAPAPWQQGDAWYCPLDDGLPPAMVKGVLGCLGNAVVPRVAAEVVSSYMQMVSTHVE